MIVRLHCSSLLLVPLALSAAAMPTAAQVAGVVTRVSVSSTGAEANGASTTNSLTPMSISADGRFVSFNSGATNLVDGDTNGIPDVFVRDLLLGTTERVSVSSAGQQGSGGGTNATLGSYGSALSADGRYVAFYSYSPNLVAGDTGGWVDVFVRDRVSGATERVSVSSSNGSPNGASQYPSLSADGRYVVFQSAGTNLVSGDKNNQTDLFVRDRVARTTRRVSVSSTGKEGNGASAAGMGNQAISADGRYVVFQSLATNLVTGDTNGQMDIFLRDLWSNVTERVSVTATGGQADGYSAHASISADGRYVVFSSAAPNLAPAGAPAGVLQVYVRDRQLGTTVCASVSDLGQAGDRSTFSHAAISGDGRFVTFQSGATNFVPGATTSGYNVFVRDLALGMTTCPTAWSGGWGLGTGFPDVAIDGDGSAIVFSSAGTNLVAGDSNGVTDVFLLQ